VRQIPDAVDTVVCAPDDGYRGYRERDGTTFQLFHGSGR